MESAAPEAASTAVSRTIEILNKPKYKAQFETRKNALRRAYAENGIEVSEAEIERDVAVDMRREGLLYKSAKEQAANISGKSRFGTDAAKRAEAAIKTAFGRTHTNENADITVSALDADRIRRAWAKADADAAKATDGDVNEYNRNEIGIFSESDRNENANGDVKYSFIGIDENGVEIYKTGAEIKNLSKNEKNKRFLRLMKEEYRGRTAKFKRNGHVFYAPFEDNDVRKNIYGDKKSDKSGLTAKINTGADGNIFELVENSTYKGSSVEHGKNNIAHNGIKYWDYFVKKVNIDGADYDLIANIRKNEKSQYVYSLQLNKAKNQRQRRSFGELNPRPIGVLTASDTNSVPHPGKDVKRKFEPNSRKLEPNNRRFSLDTDVEETRDLIAVHNLDESKIQSAFELGGFPMPSIAVTKAAQGHNGFGDISLVFDKNTIDPQRNSYNKVYGADAYTPTFPRTVNKVNSSNLASLAKKLGISRFVLEANVFEGTDINTAERRLEGQNETRAAFVKDKGLKVVPEPVLRPARMQSGIVFNSKKAKTYFQSHNVAFDVLVNDTTAREDYFSINKLKNQYPIMPINSKFLNF